MCRYTALRTSLILAAVLRPLLSLAIFLCLAADQIGLWLVALSFSFLFVSIAPVLCLNPATEETLPRRQPEGWRAALVWVFAGLPWLLMVPAVQDFVMACLVRLWDWRAITGATILCFLWLQRGLHAALAFKPSDLYPHLKRD